MSRKTNGTARWLIGSCSLQDVEVVRGPAVEPSPQLAAKHSNLVSQLPDVVVANCVVSDYNGRASLYTLKQPTVEGLTQYQKETLWVINTRTSHGDSTGLETWRRYRTDHFWNATMWNQHIIGRDERRSRNYSSLQHGGLKMRAKSHCRDTTS